MADAVWVNQADDAPITVAVHARCRRPDDQAGDRLIPRPHPRPTTDDQREEARR
jgi:hypothetical protein